MLNLYLYSVTSISLLLFYVATLVFVRGSFLLVIGGDLEQNAIRTIASGVGYAAVAFPIWWIHWGWLRQLFKRAKGDEVLGHQFYLFTVVCLNAMAILFAGGIGISSLVKYLFGAGNTSPEGVASSGVMMFTLLLSMLLWRHHWKQFSIGFNGEFPVSLNADETPAEAAS